MVLSDVSAFFVDGDYHWSQHSMQGSVRSSQSSIVSYLPVIDQCGVTLKLQQVYCLQLCFKFKAFHYLPIHRTSFLYLDPIRGPLFPHNKIGRAASVFRVSLFSSTLSSIDANCKDLSRRG